ncbi:MAG: hypothetical protein AAF998_21340 [Bacteroidota bacterium]
MRDQLCRIDVDQLHIAAPTKRCDYIFYSCAQDHYLFVELKDGEHLAYAIDQRISTVRLFREKVALSRERVSACVVSTKVPKDRSGKSSRKKLAKKKLEFELKYGSTLIITAQMAQFRF